MSMQTETTLRNRPDEASVLPTSCPRCLALATLILIAVAVVIFVW